MVTVKPDWTENVSLHSSSSVAAGGSATDDIDLDNLGADCVNVQIEIIFTGTVDGDVLVEVFSSPDSGTNDDTEPITSLRIPETASATKKVTIKLENLAYAAIKVTNNDSTASVTYESIYAWRNWLSA